MKRVKIEIGKVGVVVKNAKYLKVLETGKHTIPFFSRLHVYDCKSLYTLSPEAQIMMDAESVRPYAEVIEVRDNEIALWYEKENFKAVLSPGKYYHWKNIFSYSFRKINIDESFIGSEINRSILKKPEMLNLVRIYEVFPQEEALLFIDNNFVKKLKEGSYYFWKNDRNIEVRKIDLRRLTLEIPGQEILTADKAALRINFFIQYKVEDIEKALMLNDNYQKQLYVLTQFILREFIGSLSLDQLLTNKSSVSEYVIENLKLKAEELGVRIQNAGVKDIILPGDIKEIMNKVLIAQKQAEASVILRREEAASARNLLNTAKLMENNEMLFKLKEMEYIEKIAEKVGEITVSGGGKVLEQLKDVFSNKN